MQKNQKQLMRLVENTNSVVEDLKYASIRKQITIIDDLSKFEFISNNTKLNIKCQHTDVRQVKVRDILADGNCCRYARSGITFEHIKEIALQKQVTIHTNLTNTKSSQIIEISCQHSSNRQITLSKFLEANSCCQKQAQQNRVKDKTHHFCKDENGMSPNKVRVLNGTFYGWSDKRLEYLTEHRNESQLNTVVCILRVTRNNHTCLKIGFTTRSIKDRYSRYFDNYEVLCEYVSDEYTTLNIERELLFDTRDHTDWVYHNQEGYGHTEFRKCCAEEQLKQKFFKLTQGKV